MRGIGGFGKRLAIVELRHIVAPWTQSVQHILQCGMNTGAFGGIGLRRTLEAQTGSAIECTGALQQQGAALACKRQFGAMASLSEGQGVMPQRADRCESRSRILPLGLQQPGTRGGPGGADAVCWPGE